MTASPSRATKRSLLVSAALLATILATGCGAESPAASEEASSSAPAASTTPSAAPTEIQEPEEPTLPTAGVVSTKHGEYLQTTIEESDPAMKFDPELVESTGTLTVDQIASAQPFVARFIAEEFIDSPVNGGGQTAQEWVEDHKDILHEFAMPDLLKQAGTPSFTLVVTEDWMQEEKYADHYRYVYSSTETRVKERTITPKRIYTNEYIAVFVLDVAWAMQMDKVANGSDLLKRKGELTLGVAQNPETGDWQITGWEWDNKSE